ncbi:MAG TPA: pentapeptide repeat-containing protein [Lysobacter sp.]|nr:pentapeptide repeat-containing protein [Lysobacter sp.]
MTVQNPPAKKQTIRNRSRLVLAFGGLLVASLATPLLAQSVDVDANGNVRIDAGDGTTVRAGAAGTEVRTRGAAVRVGGEQNLSSRSGHHHNAGDNVQHTQVDGAQVNVRSDGGVQVISADGGRATTTINDRITTSSAQGDGEVSYVNQDLDDSNFSGRQLAGVAFVNSGLRRADFRDAILVGANFTNANLEGADFRGADLQNAELGNAERAGARFDGATWVDGRVCGGGSVGGCR